MGILVSCWHLCWQRWRTVFLVSRETNMKLPDTSISNIKPAVKAQKISDGGGLYLYVSPVSCDPLLELGVDAAS